MLRYSLLTAGLMLGASAFAAPAGDLPLMPWPAKVERPATQGALVKEKLSHETALAIGSTSAEFDAFIKSEQARWKPVIARAEIKPEGS